MYPPLGVIPLGLLSVDTDAAAGSVIMAIEERLRRMVAT
jgi:hypothetical protein